MTSASLIIDLCLPMGLGIHTAFDEDFSLLASRFGGDPEPLGEEALGKVLELARGATESPHSGSIGW